MELEFDKEIDALLRKGLSGRSPTGDALAAHLDADELSAFAENVLPAKTRAFHMAHIADCDRCRRVLSNLVMLNAEAEPLTMEATAAAPVITPVVQPWYRRLLLFPNLAYAMGGLVLVFGGLITFSLLQTARNEQGASISQMSEQAPAARGPMAPNEPDYGVAANTSSNASNAVANTSSNSAAVSSESTNRMIMGSASNSNAMALASPPVPAKEELEISVDGASSADVMKSSPPAPPKAITQPAPAPMAKDDSLSEADKSKGELRAEAEENKKRSAEDMRLRQSPRRDSGGATKAAPGPETSRQVYPNQSSNTFELPTRRVGGKGFSRRNSVWYDDSYSGQGTTNVRRNTEDYRKLDRGLRTIAESLDGVVVVVWTGKAYRIQ
jgi:hypothetical protein